MVGWLKVSEYSESNPILRVAMPIQRVIARHEAISNVLVGSFFDPSFYEFEGCEDSNRLLHASQ